jgi:transcriptional regulator with XRE-family HTH domain
MTAYQVSKGTGIPTSALTAWKQGLYEPKIDKLLLIADFLDVPIETFLEAKRQKPKTHA